MGGWRWTIKSALGGKVLPGLGFYGILSPLRLSRAFSKKILAATATTCDVIGPPPGALWGWRGWPHLLPVAPPSWTKTDAQREGSAGIAFPALAWPEAFLPPETGTSGFQSIPECSVRGSTAGWFYILLLASCCHEYENMNPLPPLLPGFAACLFAASLSQARLLQGPTDELHLKLLPT